MTTVFSSRHRTVVHLFVGFFLFYLTSLTPVLKLDVNSHTVVKAMPNQRQQLTNSQIDKALQELIEKYYFCVEQKGRGAMASNHEIFGIVRQESSEYESAIHQRLSDEEKIQELLDIAVAAIFGVASIRSGGVDW